MRQALYRRYRPATFADVIGQDHVTDPLQQALTNDRTHHAYLFSGPRGCGKTTSARIMARCLNCEQGPTPTPCGVCDSCVGLAPGGAGSLDVIEIDAATHGLVEDARDLRERAFFTPASSRFKVYIIDEAHMLTANAANALLKIVEEPPPHIKFIFATTEPEKVIATIRSRVHHYPFRLVPPGVLATHLASVAEQEGLTADRGALSLVVRAGRGSVRDSMSILDQLVSGAPDSGITYDYAAGLLGLTDATLLDDTLEAFAAGDGASVFQVVDRVVEAGHDPRRFAEDLLERLRDLIVIQAVPDAAGAILGEHPADELERMRLQAGHFGAASLSRAADIVNAGLTEMRGATAPRLQLELMCARVLLPAAEHTERGFSARLDRLERRVEMAPMPGTSSSPPQPHAAPARPAVAAAAPATGQQPAASARPSAAAAPRAAESDSRPGAPSESSAPAALTNASTSDPTSESTRPADDSVSRPADDPVRGPAGGSVTGTVNGPVGGSASGSASGPASGSVSSAVTSTPGGADDVSVSGSPPASPTTKAAAAPADRSTGPMSTVSTGIDLVTVRRRWPEVLEEIKTLRRFTWTLLSHNAQVAAIEGSRVTLAMVNAGARDSFLRGGSDEIVREAFVRVLGVDWKVEAIVDPSAAPGGAAADAAAAPRTADARPPGFASAASGPSAAPSARAASAVAGAVASDSRNPGDSDDSETPPPAPNPLVGPSARARATEAFRGEAAASAIGHDGPVADAIPSPDDEDVEDEVLTHHDLLVRELGAKVIGEYDAS